MSSTCKDVMQLNLFLSFHIEWKMYWASCFDLKDILSFKGIVRQSLGVWMSLIQLSEGNIVLTLCRLRKCWYCGPVLLLKEMWTCVCVSSSLYHMILIFLNFSAQNVDIISHFLTCYHLVQFNFPLEKERNFISLT